jgi:single-strand DNA-binding protein
MSGTNLCVLLGRLGKEPENFVTQSGVNICKLSIATSKDWKDDQGQKQSRTSWHTVIFYAKAAEIIKQYCHKGDQLYIEGEINYRKYQDKENKDRWITEIIGKKFSFLENNRDKKSSEPEANSFPDGIEEILPPDME